MASVDFSETCRSIPTDLRRLRSSQCEHKLLKPWLAAFGTNPALNLGHLELPHARTCYSTGTSCPRLGSTRHAPSLRSVWESRLAPTLRNSWLKMCKMISTDNGTDYSLVPRFPRIDCAKTLRRWEWSGDETTHSDYYVCARDAHNFDFPAIAEKQHHSVGRERLFTGRC